MVAGAVIAPNAYLVSLGLGPGALGTSLAVNGVVALGLLGGFAYRERRR